MNSQSQTIFQQINQQMELQRKHLINKILSNPAYAPGKPPHSMTLDELHEKAYGKRSESRRSESQRIQSDHSSDSDSSDNSIRPDLRYSVPTLSGNDQTVIGFEDAKKKYMEYVASIFDEYLESVRECKSIHDMNRIQTKTAWIANEANDDEEEDDYIHQLEINLN